MAENNTHTPVHRQIRLVVADDSDLFRKFIRELLSNNSMVSLVGEAANGVEALDTIETCDPDVIIMDMEMPGMDGIAALNHIMHHHPIPTIMTSSLSREGSARCFDSLKNGAVDFISKASLHPGKGVDSLKAEILYRIICASKRNVQMAAVSNVDNNQVFAQTVLEKQIIFCEDCGARNIIEPETDRENGALTCQQCGDLLDAIEITKYQRVSSVTVLGAGQGSFTNLLNIITRLPKEIRSAIIVVLQEKREHIDSFSRYLNALSNIKVLRLSEGMNIEAGNCYIACATDNLFMVSHSTNYTIRKSENDIAHGPLDLMLTSIAPKLKNNLVALIVSGEQFDGVKGMQQVKGCNGLTAVLNSAGCLCKELGENILKKCMVDRIVDEHDCVELLLSPREGDQSDSSEG